MRGGDRGERPERRSEPDDRDHDGYHLQLERDCYRVRLMTRGGYNWADRYPWIVEAGTNEEFPRSTPSRT